MNNFSVCPLHPHVTTYLHLLVDGLQEFALVVADSGMVNLLHQLGIFVDEPRLPQHIGCCVFYLRRTIQMRQQSRNVTDLTVSSFLFFLIIYCNPLVW